VRDRRAGRGRLRGPPKSRRFEANLEPICSENAWKEDLTMRRMVAMLVVMLLAVGVSGGCSTCCSRTTTEREKTEREIERKIIEPGDKPAVAPKPEETVETITVKKETTERVVDVKVVDE
jgi:Fe-S cluster biogenesis protein NfuA